MQFTCPSLLNTDRSTSNDRTFVVPSQIGKTCSKKNQYREDITRWRQDMNFMFEWQEQYLTSERSERVPEMLFLPRELKIHIFEPTCNVLFIIWRNQFKKAKGGNRDVIERYDTHKGVIRKMRHSGPG